jgi:hypothetical protein
MDSHDIISRNEAKMIKNADNLFKQPFLMHPDKLFYEISVVECHIKYLIGEIYNKHN